ncbi:hypothetical protein ACJMK2_026666 [Sinanodonta woodiana]|uniref:RING-type domain-containing protein n=1 Tax=Sinanodonta woodiana TaxID=1069815 RepID=A0ABD3XNR5_SINWO
MSGDRLASKLREDYLCCRICLEEYKDPVRLPCDHSFCKNCLKNIAEVAFTSETSRFVSCPLCRFSITYHGATVFDPKQWTESLPVDSLLNAILQTVEEHSKAKETVSGSSRFCAQHESKVKEAYCYDHAQGMCWECAARNHKACKYCSVEEALQGMKPELDSLRQFLRDQVTRAERLGVMDRRIDNSRAEALHELESVERSLTEFTQKVQRQIKMLRDEIGRLYGSHLRKRKLFYSQVTSLLELESSFEFMFEDADTVGILASLSDVRSQAEKAKQELDSIDKDTKSSLSEIVFVKDSYTQNFLSDFTSIGYVEFNMHEENAELGSGSSGLSLPSSLVHILHRERRNNPDNEVFPTLKLSDLFSSFYARLPGEETCHINGIVSFEDEPDILYVLDRGNEKVKKFSTSGNHVASLDLNGMPHGMCSIQPGRVLCITQPDKHLLAFIHTTDRLSISNYCVTKVPYNGVCQVRGDTLAVTAWSNLCIDILNVQGDVLTRIDQDVVTGARLFNVPNVICSTPSGKFVVAEVGNKLTCIKADIERQTRGHTSRIRKWEHFTTVPVIDMASDYRGVIYACLKEENRVCAIGPKGELLRDDVMTQVCKFVGPVAISITKKNMAVASQHNEIRVFQIDK